MVGSYCACCVALFTDIGNLGVLVLMRCPLIKFRKALETLLSHKRAEYHKQALVKMTSFVELMSGDRSKEA